MKKIIEFFKLYLSEMLFVLISILVIALSVYALLYYKGMQSLGIATLTTVVLAVAGGFIWPVKVMPRDSFRKVWNYCFILQAIAFSVCEFIICSKIETAFVHILWFVSFVAFVALFGNLVVFAFRRKDYRNNKQSSPVNGVYGKASDVLCIMSSGELARLPFNKRYLGKPIAIFPFKNAEYIELKERKGKRHTDDDVNESRLLDVDFCKRVALKRLWLNSFLTELNSPVLEGEYLADNNYMEGCGWIVAFDIGRNSIRSDYYGGNERAKLRYMGWFYEKCKT